MLSDDAKNDPRDPNHRKFWASGRLDAVTYGNIVAASGGSGGIGCLEQIRDESLGGAQIFRVHVLPGADAHDQLRPPAEVFLDVRALVAVDPS